MRQAGKKMTGIARVPIYKHAQPAHGWRQIEKANGVHHPALSVPPYRAGAFRRRHIAPVCVSAGTQTGSDIPDILFSSEAHTNTALHRLTYTHKTFALLKTNTQNKYRKQQEQRKKTVTKKLNIK